MTFSMFIRKISLNRAVYNYYETVICTKERANWDSDKYNLFSNRF